MDHWEKFNQTSLPGKEHLCSHLKLIQTTSVQKQFEKKKLGESYDLHVQSDIVSSCIWQL